MSELKSDFLRPRQFASDNNSGMCPEAWDALARANADHVPSYGEDRWTEEASDRIRDVFETNAEVFFVFNGTAANSLALASLCQSYHSILCHREAHVETDECGAPEFFSNGTKVLLLEGDQGRIVPAGIEAMVRRRSDVHYPKPRVVSVTQATELGTVYSLEDLDGVSSMARSLGLRFHMDGARFANAVVSLGARPADLTWRRGVDVLCLGGSKTGGMLGEAVVFFDRKLAEEFDYRCKQAGQLASKMRFLSAPWVGMLKDEAWLRHARHANDMARRLHDGLRATGVPPLFPTQSNAVFVGLGDEAVARLRARGWSFYPFAGAGGYRFMCSWDTRPEDVDDLARDVVAAVNP